MRTALRKKLARYRRPALAVCLICLMLVLVLVLLPWLLEDQLWRGASSSSRSSGDKQWLFWFEVASGNWSPASPPVSHWAFAFSAVVAVLLNNALLVALIGLVWRAIVVWRRVRMQVGQAFVTRDQMNKQALFKRFDVADPKVLQQVNEAFVEGEQAWRQNLYQVFGEAKANYIIDLLTKEI